MIVSLGLKYTLQISSMKNLKKYLKNRYQELKFHIVDVPNGIIWVSSQHLKQNLITIPRIQTLSFFFYNQKIFM